ncbi:MAG: hypothetical protein AB7F23_09995 [Phycisphaerae bacterium]
MDLVSLFKKNRHVLMVWLLVIIMITFVGGSVLQQVLSRHGPSKKPIATLESGTKISQKTRESAARELEVLRSLNVPQMLMYQGISGIVVSNLIFPDATSSSFLESELRKAGQAGQLVIDPEVIRAYFSAKPVDRIMVWLILNDEAYKYGTVISTEDAGKYLAALMPTAAELVSRVSEQQHVPQDNVLEIYAKLLSVVNYVELTSRNVNVTNKDVEVAAGLANETFSAEYVSFMAGSFNKELAEPTEEELAAQFEAFKGYTAGDITEENPYGFGYKLDNMVQLEYVIVNDEDVKAVVAKPTEEEKEEYYTLHKSNYVDQKKDENGQPVESVSKPYSAVVGEVEYDITVERTNVIKQDILRELRRLLNAGYSDKNIEELTAAELEAAAADYEAVAAKVGEQFGVKLYAGKTGFLTEEALAGERYLSRLSIAHAGRLPVMLSDLAFAVEGLDAVKLSPFDGKAPKTYRNIGPLTSDWPQLSAIVRVVGYQKAMQPASIDVVIDATGAAASETAAVAKTIDIRKDVTEDCKTLKAMELAGKAAAEFAELVKGQEDWSKYCVDYNKSHDVKIYVNNLKDKTRVSDIDMARAKIRAEFAGRANSGYEYQLRNKLVNDAIYALKDAELPAAVELPVSSCWYVVKNVDVVAATEEKLNEAYLNTDLLNNYYSGDAVLIVLNTDNLVARTGFKYVEKIKEEQEELD